MIALPSRPEFLAALLYQRKTVKRKGRAIRETNVERVAKVCHSFGAFDRFDLEKLLRHVDGLRIKN